MWCNKGRVGRERPRMALGTRSREKLASQHLAQLLVHTECPHKVVLTVTTGWPHNGLWARWDLG